MDQRKEDIFLEGQTCFSNGIFLPFGVNLHDPALRLRRGYGGEVLRLAGNCQWRTKEAALGSNAHRTPPRWEPMGGRLSRWIRPPQGTCEAFGQVSSGIVQWQRRLVVHELPGGMQTAQGHPAPAARHPAVVWLRKLPARTALGLGSFPCLLSPDLLNMAAGWASFEQAAWPAHCPPQRTKRPPRPAALNDSAREVRAAGQSGSRALFVHGKRSSHGPKGHPPPWLKRSSIGGGAQMVSDPVL